MNFIWKRGKVKKQSIDTELAVSLLKDAKERAEKSKKLSVKDFGKIIFENIYDSLRELLDAILALEGYKSYSHEASIAYLQILGFSDATITELDNLRYKRNSSKYYGKGVPLEDVENILSFYDKNALLMIDKIEEMCKKMNRCAKD